jgi:hypothetical protein
MMGRRNGCSHYQSETKEGVAVMSTHNRISQG